MTTKTKNTDKAVQKLATVTQQAGLLLMTAAVTLGMLELPDKGASKIVVPSQPAFELAGSNSEDSGNNPLRREREEAGPHYVSYSVNQRTPSRSGKH